MGKKKTLSIVLLVALVILGALLFGEIRSNRAAMADKNAQIEALNAELASKTAQLEALDTDLAGKNSEIEGLNADLAGKTSEIDSLNEALEGKTSEIESLTADLNGKKSEIEGLNADLSGKQTEIDSLTADIARKNSEIENQSVVSAQAKIPDSVLGKYDSTRAFLYTLDQAGMTYNYKGVDSDGDDAVEIPFLCGGKTILMRVWFTPDCKRATFHVWDLIEFADVSEGAVMYACNELNRSYSFISFHAMEDNSVTAAMDLIFHAGDNIGATTFEGLCHVISILDDAYAKLARFGK